MPASSKCRFPMATARPTLPSACSSAACAKTPSSRKTSRASSSKPTRAVAPPSRPPLTCAICAPGRMATKPCWCVTKCRPRSEEHTSELQSLRHLGCRLLLEKKQRAHGTHDPGLVWQSEGLEPVGADLFGLHSVHHFCYSFFFLMIRGPPGSTLLPYTALFRT